MRIFLDGLWGLGKTKIGMAAAESLGFKYIKEPIITASNLTQKERDLAYYKSFIAKLEESESYPSVILERSVFSVSTFLKFKNTYSNVYRKFENKYVDLARNNDKFVFFASKNQQYERLVNYLGDYRRDLLEQNPDIHQVYDEIYLSTISSFIKEKNLFILNSIDKGKHKNAEVLTNLLISKIVKWQGN